MPLLALLTRRLTNDEVKAVAHDLVDRGDFDHIDIGVLITQITDELPRAEDVERVRERLAAKGWPLDDPRDAEDAGDTGTAPAPAPGTTRKSQGARAQPSCAPSPSDPRRTHCGRLSMTS